MALRIGIVVGEVSGDIIGAALIAELRKQFRDLEVEGVIGPKLLEQGCQPLYSMERLAVMGLLEPLKRLPELLRMRNWLAHYFTNEPPDLFIGIDAPEFNLGLEKKLKAAAIPTIHYVSPSVWAWREQRLKTIKAAVDLMLTLFPFEESYYQSKAIPVKFVGHPAADKIPLNIDVAAAKAELGFHPEDKVIALLPGSRNSEIKRMAELYLKTAKLCVNSADRSADFKFIVPLVSVEHQVFVDNLHQQLAKEVPLQTIVGATYQAIAASDLVLVTSGTATLEVMLHKKPMIIAYKTNYLTYKLVNWLIKVPYIGLPNLLAMPKFNKATLPQQAYTEYLTNKSNNNNNNSNNQNNTDLFSQPLVTELIQAAATPENLYQELLNLLNSTSSQQRQIDQFTQQHVKLRKNSSAQAAAAIIEMLGIC